MTEKKIVRLAVIRTNDEDGCPYQLPVPVACKMAGDMVDRMASLDMLDHKPSKEEAQKIMLANMRLWTWTLMQSAEEPKPCKYANKLFEEKQAVDCSYGDTAAGEVQSKALVGSPFYSQIFQGIGLEGLYSLPLEGLSDYGVARNAYYSLYSLQGSEEVKAKILKLAHEYINKRIISNNDE